MRLLYGSQNFGYDTKDSDKDWVEFIYPTWQDILNNHKVSKEVKNKDGSITKVKDIRCLLTMIEKCNFNDLQLLYSQKVYECEDLKWFFDHREEIVKHNLKQLYFTNRGYIVGCLLRDNSKDRIRAYCFMQLIERAFSDEPFSLHDENLGLLRELAHHQIDPDTIIKRVDDLKEMSLEASVNHLIIVQARKEIERLLKINLK